MLTICLWLCSPAVPFVRRNLERFKKMHPLLCSQNLELGSVFLVEIKDLGELHTWFDLEQHRVMRKYRTTKQCLLKTKLKGGGAQSDRQSWEGEPQGRTEVSVGALDFPKRRTPGAAIWFSPVRSSPRVMNGRVVSFWANVSSEHPQLSR